MLIHINLQFGRGSSSIPPPDLPVDTHVTSGSSRVHFTPSTVDPIPDIPTAPPPEQRSVERSIGEMSMDRVLSGTLHLVAGGVVD